MKSTHLLVVLCLLCLGGVGCDALLAGGDEGTAPLEFPISYEVENRGADCPAPPLPPFSELPSVEALPNPFAWSGGSDGTIARRLDWQCRRAEIAAEIQNYELGDKPAPPAAVEASYSADDSLLTVTVGEGGSAITLTAPVSVPEGEGPFPAVIGVDGPTGFLPPEIFTSRGIATVQFNSGEIAPVYSGRGEGPFYDLHSSETGTFAAWAWGMSRIIDGLEATPALNLNLSRLGVTGCSYAGKIALFSGALDERIALTIAQEPGGGGAAAWRVTEALDGERETLANTTETWYRPSFPQFGDAVARLPYDHHELMALVAPRALFVLGNPAYEWLAEESGYVSSRAAQEVWGALDVPDRFGFSIVGDHPHCALPDSQRPEVTAFVEKYLLGNESANTDIATTPYDTDLSRWITWETPELE